MSFTSEKGQKNERLHLIDNLKGVLIFLVVLGHSLEPYKEKHLLLSGLYIFIYLFHMPAFVFVSGYLSKNVQKSRNSAFKNFLIPFILFNSLWNVMTSVATKDLSMFSFITPGWALWYLLSMFFWKVFLKDLVRIRYILPLSIIIGLFAGIFNEFDTTLSLSRTLVFLPFFLMGYFTDEKHLFRLQKPSRFFSFTIILIASSFAGIISYFEMIPIEFLYGSQSFQSTTVPIWIGLVGRLLMYIIGFSFVFVLANVIPNRASFFSRVGMNTFPIYIIHTYLLMILFGINYFITFFWLRIFFCLLGTIIITASLSRPKITHYFDTFLNKAYNLVLITPKK